MHTSSKQTGPLECFQIKWGQANVFSVIPPWFELEKCICQKYGRTNPLFFHMFRRPCIETNRVVPSIWQQTRIRSWFSLNGFITYYTVQLTATVIFTPCLLSFLKSFHRSEFSKIFKWLMKFINSEKTTKFFKISTLLLTGTT